MKSFLCKDFLICLIVVIAALAGFSKADFEQSKLRRAGTSGLIAFPRVGRSNPSLSNSLHDIDTSGFDNIYAASLEEYEEYPKEKRYSGLKPHARIGRNDNELRKWAHFLALQQALDKRTGPSATSGLWFGPRLGKRSVDNEQHAQPKGQKEEY